MLKLTTPIDNIHRTKKIYTDSTFEQLLLTRSDLGKRLLRRQTHKGTDVGIQLGSGTVLHDGDIFQDDDTNVLIVQLPEKTLSIKCTALDKTGALVLLGHIIGNRHRPISIQDDTITFPIQSDTEKTTFEKLFHDILPYISMTVKEQIFTPHQGADVHGH